MSTMSLPHAGSLPLTLRRLIRMRAEAMRVNHPAILSTLEAAMALVHTALTVERRHAAWAASQPGGRDAQELGRRIDTRVATLHATLVAFAQQDPPVLGSRAAAALRWQLFPNGLHDHIQSPLAAQVHSNDTLVLFLTSPLHAPTVRAMGLTTMVDEIATLNAHLQRLLTQAGGPPLQDVTEARQDAHLAVELALQTIDAFIHLADPADAPALSRITAVQWMGHPDGAAEADADLPMPGEHDASTAVTPAPAGTRRHQSLQAHATLALQR